MSHIIEFTASNVKRLKAVRIRPAPNGVTEIVGRNGQGKTSVIDAIMYVIGGKSRIDGTPLRDGAERGEATVEFSDFIATRRFTAGGGTTLEIRTRDGAKVAEPQRVLDAMLSSIAFDPIAFMRMRPKEQGELLRQVAGLDFTKADTLRAKTYEERTAIRRQADAAKAIASRMPAYDGMPDQEIDIAGLVSEQQAAARASHERAAKVREAESVGNQIERLHEQIARLKTEIREAEAALEHNRDASETLRRELEAMPPAPDIDQASQRVVDATNENRKIRANIDRSAALREADALARQVDSLTDKIKAIDDRKAALVAQAKMPVDGLGFDAEGAVTLNGLPLANAGGAERLRASVAIAMAVSPGLRACMIDEAGSLDADSMALLERMAEEHDFQVLLTRVDPLGGSVRIVIEDGEVAGAA